MHRLPARDASQGEPHSYTSLDGSVHLHVDLESFDFYIEAKPEHDHRALCDAITQAEWYGLSLVDDDGYEPELLEDGSTRIHLAPIIPVHQVAPLSLASVERTLPSRATRMAVVAALASLLLSPVLDAFTGMAVAA